MFKSHASSGIVKVFAGKERRLYQLHKTLLCHESPYFEKCLNPAWSEGTTGEVTLEEDPVEAFDHFVDWIYSHKIANDMDEPFGETYMLADKFGMEAFKNDIVDAATGATYDWDVFPSNCLKSLFNNHLGESQLARLLVDKLAEHCVRVGFSRYFSQMHKEAELGLWHWISADRDVLEKFLMALEVAHKVNESEDGFGKPMCHYHDHKHTQPC